MINKKTRKAFQQIVGTEYCLMSKEDLISYSYDGFLLEFRPDAVLLPSTTEEISEIMKIAYGKNIPVIPRGAGTNISGGSVAINGGIIVALTRMNKINIDKKNRIAIVQPGVINKNLQEEVEKVGFFYPPDPGSMTVSTMGGNVAENAGGPRGVKYGVTKDYIIGLEVVLSDGRIIKIGSKTTKNVTGLDLLGLFIGSEGTLGIITEIICKLIPKPEATLTVQATFKDLNAASNAVSKIMESGILPVSLELMDSVVINAVEDNYHAGLPRNIDALLLIQVDGPKSSLLEQLEKIANICMQFSAVAVIKSNNIEEEDKLWFARRATFGTMAKLKENCIVEDVTVPVSNIPTMVKEIVSIGNKYNIQIGILAHAGDGNMHPLILADKRNKEEWGRTEMVLKEIVLKAIDLGGVLSGEHGIGLAKKDFLDISLDKNAYQIMKNIKNILDSKNILNPGKFI